MEFRDKIDEFKLYIPLIQGLCNPGMRERHWDMLSESIKMDIKIDPSLTVSRCLEMNLLDHIKSISEVAEAAGKEYAIENVRREGLLSLWLLLKYVSVEQVVIVLGDVLVVLEHETHSAAKVKRLLCFKRGAVVTQLSHLAQSFSCSITVLPDDLLVGSDTLLWD